MFTWICPKCGREVPPAYTDCPDCNPQEASAGAAPPPQKPYGAPPVSPAGPGRRRPIWQSGPAPAPPPAYAAPPEPPPQAYAAPPPEPPPVHAAPPVQEPRAVPFSAPPEPPRPAGMALPTWLLAIVFTLAFGGVVAGAYWLFGSKGTSASSAAAGSGLPIPAVASGANANPYQKFIEISGIRFAEDPKDKDKTIVKFVITNHADDDITRLSGNVAIVAKGDKTGQAAAAFSFTTSLGSQESKDLTTALTTKMKTYELPDWQFAQPVLEITAPAATSGGSQ